MMISSAQCPLRYAMQSFAFQNGRRACGRPGGRGAANEALGIRALRRTPVMSRTHRLRSMTTRASSDPSDDQGGGARNTLDALDSMLGVEEEPESEEPEDGPSVLTVPLLWKVQPTGPQLDASTKPPCAQGNSPLAAASPTQAALSSPTTSYEYMCLTLKFPQRATASQRQRGVAGVELDFVLDTACSNDFILPQVAMELAAEVVGETPGGVSATGNIAGGLLVMLGDVELGGTVIINGFNAIALALPTAGTAGLLGKRFLDCFEAVEFQWAERPGVAKFYQEFEWDACTEEDTNSVPLEELSNTLLSAEVTVGGTTMRALLDTGAPLSIINLAAAKALGLEPPEPEPNPEPKSANPFARLKNALAGPKLPEGSGILVAGAGGQPMRIAKAAQPVDIKLGEATQAITGVEVLVGDLPVFADGLIVSPEEPGLVLGLDVLSRMPWMVLSTRNKTMMLPRSWGVEG